ncbi:MAG: gluconeogenesis factor YvcK family protein [Thermotogota bacterium]
MKNVVVIGGGTGLNQLLRGLKWFKEINLTSIVAVTDEGGSSGVIRNDFEIPPPGDIRNNIMALSEKESLITKLLGYRFNEGFLKNHNLGNIILLALTRINNNNFPLAIKTLSDFLNIKGRVLPSSFELIRIAGEFEDGAISFGEKNLVSQNKKISRVWLDGNSEAYEESTLALKNADCIILGPGSLYTSIITNLLVKGIKESIKESNSNLIYISNIMTQPGETNGYNLAKHVQEIEYYLDHKVNHIIANSGKIPNFVLERYKKRNSTVVKIDFEDERIIQNDLVYFINKEKTIVRHDSTKLSKIIKKIIGD